LPPNAKLNRIVEVQECPAERAVRYGWATQRTIYRIPNVGTKN